MPRTTKKRVAGRTVSGATETKEDYLKRIYTDPGQAGSFSGLDKLKKVASNDGRADISTEDIATFLQKQDTYTANRPARQRFKRSRVIAYGINDLVDIDLADFSKLSKFNKKYKFLLVAIDVFSRFAKVVPLRDKTATSVLSALQGIYGTGPVPHKIRSDRGLEFKNSKVSEFFKSKGIKHYFASPPIKAGYAERLIESLKQLVYKYLYHEHTYSYIDVLDKLIDNYNSRPHRGLGNLAPKNVNELNEASLWNRMYVNSLGKSKSTTGKSTERQFSKGSNFQPARKYNFDRGNLVRISYTKSPFQRAYKQSFTDEVFLITDRYLIDSIPVYKLSDTQNEIVEGVFYGPDLQRVIKPDTELYKIDRILRRKGKGRDQQVLVRWQGYGPKFDSWVLKSSVKNIGKQ